MMRRRRRRTLLSASVSNSLQVQYRLSYGPKSKFQYGDRRSNMSHSLQMSNLLRIHSKMAELWPFNWFQDGFRPPSWILAVVTSDGKSGCGTLGGNICNINQVIALNVNFNMAAAAILNFFPCQFLSFGRFWVVAVDVPVKCRTCTVRYLNIRLTM